MEFMYLFKKEQGNSHVAKLKLIQNLLKTKSWML
jgi:hypothetical protein